MEELTYLYFPKSKYWENSLKLAFQNAGLPLVSQSPRSLEMRISGSRLPIRLFLAQPSDILTALNRPELKGRAGIVANDTAQENGFSLSSEFPLYGLERTGNRFPRPKITIATTPKFFEQLPDCVSPQQAFDPKRMEGTIYAPKSYENISRKWLENSGADINRVKLRTFKGSIEGWWKLDNTNEYIVDVLDSGETQKQNGCDPVATILNVYLGFIEQPNLSPKDQQVIADLKGILDKAAQKGGGY